MTDYEIRPFKPGDVDGFRSLYATVMGERKGREWFDWKYGENPYADGVPGMVTVRDGRIVAARPFLALPMRVGGEREVALQPADTMVHPDHRRQGLFTRMTERSMERYGDDHPFFFNFPNERSRAGYEKLGWAVVSERESYYRIRNPRAVGRSRGGGAAVRLASAAATPLARAYYGIRDRTAPESPEIAVETVSDPAATLAELAASPPPDRIHAARDEEFYRWRLGNPDWEYTAYVAEREGDPEAAVVAGTATDSGVTTTRILDVAPLEGAPEDALAAAVGRIVADQAGTDVFVAPPQGIPAGVLRAFGFHLDSVPPLSRVASPTSHVVRALPEDRSTEGSPIADPDGWLLTFVEADTS
jgi:GNAT superfamily N-acetyltransferase